MEIVISAILKYDLKWDFWKLPGLPRLLELPIYEKKMNSDNLQTFITHYVQTPIFVPNQFIKKLLVNKNHEKSLNHF